MLAAPGWDGQGRTVTTTKDRYVCAWCCDQMPSRFRASHRRVCGAVQARARYMVNELIRWLNHGRLT